MKLLKALLIQAIIVVIFAGAMFGLNFLTGPIIEANNQGAEYAPLIEVMPEGAVFTSESLIYSADNAGASSLVEVPESVKAVYKENNDMGYAIKVEATSQYSEAPMQIVIGVSADGKIAGINITSYNDTAGFDFRAKDPNYLPSYIGKDSALADIGTVTGSTFSSTAFKNAVSEAMNVLIVNDMIQAGVKSDEQILTEMIEVVAPGFVGLEEVTVSGNIKKGLKSSNGAGFAYVIGEGEANFLAVVNGMGVCKVYNVEGVEVTAEKSAIITEAKAHATLNQADYLTAFTTTVGQIMQGATEITAVEVDTFNSVVVAVSFKLNGENYYAFYARPVGFHQMDVYVVIDGNGAIAKVSAKQLIFEEQYFFGFAGVPNGYLGGFNGVTEGTWGEGDLAIIAGATMTSNAMKQAVTDAFNSFDSLNLGGNQ